MGVVPEQDVLGAVVVRAWAAAALTVCRAARERIDAVNVFPVPDADTGSNVALTVAGGVDAVARTGADAGTGAVAAAFADGAARAARGSSGIILSQWLVGFAGGLAACVGGIGTQELVAALDAAAVRARGAVPDPQEGTVLTLAREIAAHARRTSDLAPDGRAGDVLAAAAEAVRVDLGRLSAGHDVLRAARVVDAGACALLVVVDALVHTLRTGPRVPQEGDIDLGWLPRARPGVVAGCAPAAGGAFEVMMLVASSWPGAVGLAAALQEVGDAVAVVDAGDVRHAHVHCDDPSAALALVPAVERRQVVVRRVDEPVPAERGLVVLTPSPGLAAWYATCGAVTLVGPDADPDEVARALLDTRAGQAVVVDAGVGAPAVPGGHDLLVTAGDGPAVVACLALVADPHLASEAAAQALARLRTAGPVASDAVPGAVAGLLPAVPEAQGVTLVHGDDVGADAARAVADGLAAAFPQLEVVVAGPTAGSAWWVGVD